VHLSTPDYRFNQYDLWKEEIFAEGDPLFAVQSKNLDPPNLTRMATGQMKGFVIIEKFQSLNGLQFELENISRQQDELNFELRLTNKNDHSIFTRHVSDPVIALMQNQKELHFVPLTHSSEKNKITAGSGASLTFAVPEKLFDSEKPLTIYTRSKYKVRGEIISLRIDSFNIE
jgi:hypothetical protein